MKEKTLWAYLKAYIDQLIAQNGDHHLGGRDVLKRTCSAVIFSGLSKGTLSLTSSNGTQKNKGLLKEDRALKIDLSCFPQLLEDDAILWIIDADLIVVREAASGYRAYTTICPNWKEQSESCDNGDELRCPKSSEFLFDLGESINKEEGSHLISYPVTQEGSMLIVTLNSGQ